MEVCRSDLDFWQIAKKHNFFPKCYVEAAGQFFYS